MKSIGIGVWKKESGNMMSHKSGLDEDQIALLQSLKVGDRLILWNNYSDINSTKPDFTIKKSESKKDLSGS